MCGSACCSSTSMTFRTALQPSAKNISHTCLVGARIQAQMAIQWFNTSSHSEWFAPQDANILKNVSIPHLRAHGGRKDVAKKREVPLHEEDGIHALGLQHMFIRIEKFTAWLYI